MIGQPVSRRDGILKVMGRAAYSHERKEGGQALYGVMVGATIARGRIVSIDAAAAERAPGTALVMTHRNAPAQGLPDPSIPHAWSRPWPVLSDDRVVHFGQPVALVVAATFEQARAAASLVAVTYAAEPGAFDLATHKDRAHVPKTANVGLPTDTAFGDLDRAMAEAPVTLDQTYTTPHHVAHPMEPAACVAHWTGDGLAVMTSVQNVAAARLALARTLMIPPERIHVDAAYVGGGFGSKIRIHEEAVFAALAARRLGRPVKVAHARRQVADLAGHRPEMIHHVRLAAGRDGRLMGVGHDVNMQGAERDPFTEQAATVMRSLYAAPSRLTRHRVTNLNLNVAEPVRGPGELPALLAIESAMDDLATRLGIDPVELRIRNEPDLDPELGVPLSGRRLVECMRTGAMRFGWADRPKQPGSRRQGNVLIGYGMAAAIRMHFQGASRASVRVDPGGRVTVRSDLPDIGTGSYTILAQVAAGRLGVPMSQVAVELARTDLPPGAGAGGSQGASNTCTAVHRACEALMRNVAAAANVPGERLDLLSEVARRFPDGIEEEGSIVGQNDDPNHKDFSRNTYGASFAEVGVDGATGEVRLRRMLGVFAAGRIINPKTARSQLIGGMIWGVSSTLHEAAHVDPRHGHFVNSDLGEYLVPVHADIPDIEAMVLDDFDAAANPLGMKGIGELAVCRTGAAVANALYNATGVRIRDFPITTDKLLPGLPNS